LHSSGLELHYRASILGYPFRRFVHVIVPAPLKWICDAETQACGAAGRGRFAGVSSTGRVAALAHAAATPAVGIHDRGDCVDSGGGGDGVWAGSDPEEKFGHESARTQI